MARPRLGVQPGPAQRTSVGRPALARRGRGGGPGNHPGRSPGGAPQRRPKGGVYGGKAGEALTNEDPESFLRTLTGMANWSTGTGNMRNTWANTELVPLLMSQYAQRGQANQNMSVMDFMRNVYGIQLDKKGRIVGTGSLTSGAGGLDAAYRSWEANQDQLGYLTDNFAQQGGYSNVGGNSEFRNFVNQEFAPGAINEFNAQARVPGSGMQNWDQFVQQNNLLKRARAAFRVRPNTMRTPSPVSPTGRFSWWE